MVLWWKKKKPEEAPAPEKPADKPAEKAAEKAPAKASAGVELAEEPAERQGWFSKLTAGIARTRANFTGQIRSLFQDTPKIDENFYEELEHILIAADCGVEITQEVVAQIRHRAGSDPSFNAEKGLAAIKETIRGKVAINTVAMNLNKEPFSVILVVGVNGVGKTTTIAKLANIFKAYGQKMMLIAGDTFRAGAIEQLGVWGDRLGIDVHKGQAGADPSAVIFDGLNAARARKVDLVVIDTAGRLHTQVNLMEEIRKVRRVIQKVLPDAPHETWLVLDSTTGQNAINQAALFDKALKLTGLVLTKLDGTAKGGIVVAISQKLGLPIRFVGVGEGIDDLNAFKPEEFVEALFADGGK